MASESGQTADPPIRFLHLLTTRRGGAGRAAWRLHEGLTAAGHDSRAIMLEVPERGSEAVLALAGDRSFRIRRLMVKALLKLEARSDYGFSRELLSAGLPKEVLDAAAAFSPDVIVVHAITHFLGPQDVLALQQATGAPVIWHLMDMAVFTGGCHYAWDCRKYETACRECPALRLPGKTDLAARAWEAKKQAMAAIKGHVVAGASRLAMQARASAVLGHLPIDKIMLGLVPSEFGPKDIREERRHLDIPEDGRVVFFGVQNFDERRKGARHLLDALRQLPAKMPAGSELPFLLIAGKPAGMPNFDSLGYRHRYLGFLNAPALAKVYAAADVFICPSIEDSGPMMVNEALMSGTPVVAFRMGVVPDLVEPGITGEIAELGDASSLAEGLSRVLLWDDAARAQSRRRCREVAIAKSGASLQVARFVALAKSLNSGGGNCGMTASRTRSGDKG